MLHATERREHDDDDAFHPCKTKMISSGVIDLVSNVNLSRIFDVVPSGNHENS
jgi:hypothetical protein